MTPEQFRAVGHQMVDFVAGYLERAREFPVLSQATPGEVFGALPDLPPERAGDAGEWDAIFRDLESIILPGLTHWQHPSFFAFFPANTSGPAILAELLSAGLGVQGMLWQTSPACTEVETKMLDWMADACGLPEKFLSTSATGGGVIQGTASEATLVALVAARERLRSRGKDPAAMTLYASSQAHSSIAKAAMIAGHARSPEDFSRMRLIVTDDALAIDCAQLREAIERDLAAGLEPGFVCATVGTTSTTAVDPLDGIANACRGHDVWLHADAAHSGAATVCEEHRWMLRGIESFDSYCFNPHKWLLTNFDCDLFWTSDRQTLTRALSIMPAYLRTAEAESGRVIDYRDWQVPLGRRFRSLKLWFVLRHYGLDGLRAHIRHSVALAEMFEQKVRGSEAFEIAAPRTVNLVCLRSRMQAGETVDQADTRTRALAQAINRSGRAYVTLTTVPDAGHGGLERPVLRVAIGGTQTRAEHVEALWALVLEVARDLGHGGHPATGGC